MGMEEINIFMITALHVLLLKTKTFIAQVLHYYCCCVV